MVESCLIGEWSHTGEASQIAKTVCGLALYLECKQA